MTDALDEALSEEQNIRIDFCADGRAAATLIASLPGRHLRHLKTVKTLAVSQNLVSVNADGELAEEYKDFHSGEVYLVLSVFDDSQDEDD